MSLFCWLDLHLARDGFHGLTTEPFEDTAPLRLALSGGAALWRELLGLLSRNVPGAALRIGGGSLLGLLAGLLALVACHRWLYRRGWLDLGRRWDRWVRVPVLALWVVVWPASLGLAGAMVGTGFAAAHVVRQEQIGRRAAVLAFKGLAAAVLASTEGNASDPAADARAWASGERRIEIAMLSERLARAPADLSERAAAVTQSAVAGEGSGAVRSLASRMTAWTVRWLAAGEAGRRLRALQPVVTDLQAEDRAGDGDGLVTVEEIAGSISRVHVEPRLSRLLVESMALQALPVPLLPLACVAIPVGLLRLLAKLWPPRPVEAKASAAS